MAEYYIKLRRRIVYRGDVYDAINSERLKVLPNALEREYTYGVHDGLKRALEILSNDVKDIPAADVAEVRHGKNIGEDYDAVDQFVCSECGIELQGWYRVERDMDDGEETHHEYVMRYCPNCSARMDKEEDT